MTSLTEKTGAKSKMNRALSLTFAGVIVFATLIGVLIYYMWFFMPINIHTSSGWSIVTTIGPINGTLTNSTALNEISAQTAPTLVNGIVASTSVIIGFMATFSGIFLANVAKNDRKTFGFILTVVFEIPIILFFLFLSLMNLAMGELFFGMAIKLSWLSFLLALFMVISLFLAATYIIHAKERSEQTADDKTQEGRLKPTSLSPGSCRITIKEADRFLEAEGIEGDTINKILQTWRADTKQLELTTKDSD